MKVFLRILIVIGIIATTLLPTIPVAATTVAVPTSAPTINYAFVYRHYLETDDQLYLVGYTWPYAGTFPTDYPVQTASETIFVRLLDGAGAELASVSPYTYYRNGYDMGIAVIYFSATDAPAWSGSYTVNLEGTPFLSWSAARPVISLSSFDLWSTSTSTGATRLELWAKIQYIASQISSRWSTSLLDNLGGTNYLSADGENYFSNVFPYLRNVIPGAFETSAQKAAAVKQDKGEGYATGLLSGIAGSVFDFSSLVAGWGAVGTLLLPVVWIAASIFGVAKVCEKAVHSTKPFLLLMLVPIIVGAKIGVLPMVAAIMLGVIGTAITAWALWFDKAAV